MSEQNFFRCVITNDKEDNFLTEKDKILTHEVKILSFLIRLNP